MCAQTLTLGDMETMMVKHALYASIEDMTRPETLRSLVGRPITRTRLVPFQPLGWSSTESQFVAVETDDSAHGRYVVKRMDRDGDWVMLTTEDHHWRAITIWQHGLLDRLPDEIDDAIIACAADGAGYAILMHDVSATLLRGGADLSIADMAFLLDAMAALHVAYWDDTALFAPALRLCSPRQLFTHTAPSKVKRVATLAPSRVLTIILEGWDLLPTVVEADVAQLMGSLAHDPQPLCTALARYPRTLVHGDWRLDNFGIRRGEHPRLVLLDWTRSTPTVPAFDLAYYLVTSGYGLPFTRETAIDLYKERLAARLGTRFDEAWWQPQLELSLLSAFLMIGCIRAWFAKHRGDEQQRMHDQAELVWWAEKVRVGVKWLTE